MINISMESIAPGKMTNKKVESGLLVQLKLGKFEIKMFFSKQKVTQIYAKTNCHAIFAAQPSFLPFTWVRAREDTSSSMQTSILVTFNYNF